MKIQEWFDKSGSFTEGVELYSKLPNRSVNLMRLFKVENFSNFIRLKHELKVAINKGLDKVEIPEIPKIPKITVPLPAAEADPAILKSLIESSSKSEFDKENMAIYPRELHPVYRERISNFYKACELKFELNALAEDSNDSALDLILQIESLWDKIDKAWVILHHWRDHHRLMPTEVSKDYSTFTPMQLANEKCLLETRISKRRKTILGIEKRIDSDPSNRVLANSYNQKKEELEQLIIDLEIIKKILKNG